MSSGIQGSHEEPPGPNGLPVIGNLRDIARERPWFLERTAAEYGDVVRYRFGPGREMYGLFHPDHVGRVLVDERENYCKGDFFNSRMAFLGDSVLTSEGAAWRDQRGVIEPIFHPNRIEAYVADMATYTERLADSWSDGEVRDVYDDYIGLALEIVAGALFDFDIRRAEDDIGGSLDQVMAHFRRKSRRPVDVPDWLPTPENLRYRRAVRTLDRAVSDIVRELSGEKHGRGPPTDGDGSGGTQVEGEHALALESHGTGGAFARLVDGFDAEGEPANEELHSQVTTLLVAGHETTAQAMAYACYLLAHHPSVEERLVAEVRSVLDDAEVTAADVPRLEYTQQVIREAMRLYPPVPSFPRETVEADVVDGYRIPAGNTVWVSPWVVQRDERFWNNPGEFDPDRWGERSRDDRHPFAYFPFGGGPRRCLGDRFAMMEASVVLATLLRDYSLEPVPGRDLELAPAITLRPAGGLALEVRER